jgi:thiol-disulfide isomerase/thioredoxin
LFTPSCSHCRTELHQLSQLSRHFPSLAFYAVSLGTSDETMRLIAGIDNGIPVFLDRDQFARHWFSVRRVPLLLFVDESDVIRRALTGARPVQEDSVLLSRFSRPGTPGASGVGRVEEMDARMFPERPRRQ